METISNFTGYMLLVMALPAVPPLPAPAPEPQVITVFSGRTMFTVEQLFEDPKAALNNGLQLFIDQARNQGSTLARDLGVNEIEARMKQ